MDDIHMVNDFTFYFIFLISDVFLRRTRGGTKQYPCKEGGDR
jgi:hypothetical protein